jgi:hypothetical protein
MARKRHTAEEIVAKLRQVDVLMAQGRQVADAVRAIGVTTRRRHTASSWSRSLAAWHGRMLGRLFRPLAYLYHNAQRGAGTNPLCRSRLLIQSPTVGDVNYCEACARLVRLPPTENTTRST